MTIDDFKQNEDLVKSWRDARANEEILKIVLQAMDESSPIYGGVPEIDEESESFRLGFQRGYAFYHKKLQELATLPPVNQPIKATYPPRK